jgi:hypothetical protein
MRFGLRPAMYHRWLSKVDGMIRDYYSKFMTDVDVDCKTELRASVLLSLIT